MSDLRRTYAAEPSLAGAYGMCALTLGYETLADEDLSLGDPATRSLLLDLGPGLMDGYLASLAARHLPADERAARRRGARARASTAAASR